MPSPLSADHPTAQPPVRGQVDSLITQTRRLKGEVDAVRRDAQDDATDPRGRWQRALCDLALHQLDDLDAHLAQLRDGPPAPPPPPQSLPPGESLLSRVGSAEWNLLTDEAFWSPELYGIVGRDPGTPPLTLDELPSLVHDEDRPRLTAMVTGCLIDAKPIDGEFRVVRPDGEVRTVHMMGEPVLDADGSTTSMWAVLRDVSELRRSQRAVRETRDSLHPRRHPAQPEHRIAAEPRDAEPRPWPGSLRLPHHPSGPLDVAARHLPAPTGSPIGGSWYDSVELPGGDTLLGVGGLTAHSPDVTSTLAMTLGALRGMAMSGAGPAQLLSWLDQLLDAGDAPTLCSTLCCRYRPATRTLAWAQAGHPAPLLFRDGTGRRLDAPAGVLLGSTSGAAHGQAEETLEEGDLLLLHTDGLVPAAGPDTADRLLDLAPRLVGRATAQDCARLIVEEFGDGDRQDDACVLVARVTR
ncbi:PP2C family protein-serine/threonine phosphatase [Streptomyces phaeoluteigriseus]|uniref:PP2C family protein-serine/threonine phosphatase n=1 Tax=Streptomyces phaeoluteigriseus TaxID=114686 RepID=UPI003673CD21